MQECTKTMYTTDIQGGVREWREASIRGMCADHPNTARRPRRCLTESERKDRRDAERSTMDARQPVISRGAGPTDLTPEGKGLETRRWSDSDVGLCHERSRKLVGAMHKRCLIATSPRNVVPPFWQLPDVEQPGVSRGAWRECGAQCGTDAEIRAKGEGLG